MLPRLKSRYDIRASSSFVSLCCSSLLFFVLCFFPISLDTVQNVLLSCLIGHQNSQEELREIFQPFSFFVVFSMKKLSLSLFFFFFFFFFLFLLFRLVFI